MKWRLLLDIEVIEFLQTLRAPMCERLFAVFRRIQDFPGNYRQFTETDPAGRLLSAVIFEGYAIYYWEGLGRPAHQGHASLSGGSVKPGNV